ncbi:MAG TPA: DUF423 domain-containing protein [Candidatus Udaeobacter sp.]|jgi:uncharacterized membrane protein YgdD (TMEM256/DUF423 family)|nr:DUF423 domain-containing protein [Candidatus Udaeobacter sp.]
MGDTSRRFAAIGAWLGLAAVATGAFGAHALRSRIDPIHLQTFETAVRYHILHALALLAVGLSGERAHRPLLNGSGILFIVGIALFSGSLYALAIGAPRWIGILTPFGGVALMGAWACLGAALSIRPRAA